MTEARIGVVGAGIIGLAVARRLAELRPDATVTVLEKEHDLALHQTGRNSGVVHAGIYYAPGSLKAELCRRGVGLLRAYVEGRGIPYEECGKLVVALDEGELDRLRELERRAAANGVPGMRWLEGEALREIEPHALGVAGLHSPTTAITDYRAVARAFAADVEAAGGSIVFDARVDGDPRRGCERPRRRRRRGARVRPARRLRGAPVRPPRAPCRRRAGADDRPVPRRVLPARAPDASRSCAGSSIRFPTRSTRSSASTSPAGSAAASTSGRTPCSRSRARAIAAATSGWPTSPRRSARPASARSPRKHWRMGAHELRGSLSRRAFAAEARRYVAEVTAADLVPAPAGVRAQALDPDGSLVDDFRINRIGPVTAVRNAPSPGATSSMAIAEHIVAGALAD